MLNNYRFTLSFYFYSTIIPWTLWFISAYLSHRSDAGELGFYISLLGFLGLLGPLIVSIWLITKEKYLWTDVKNRLIFVPFGKRKYFLMALFLMPLSIILAMTISLLFGYDINQFVITGKATFTSLVFPVWFLLVIAPVIEELAWHSYGTDALRRKYTLFTTSIVFALYWGIWHIPLAFIEGYYHSNLVLDGAIYSINFLVSMFPFVFLMNWLYYKTDRNILVAILMHLNANVFNEIFATHPDSKIIQTILLLILSIYIVYTQKEMFFRK